MFATRKTCRDFAAEASHETEVESHNIPPIRRGGVSLDDVCEGFPAVLKKTGANGARC
ncbi:hypothetical protein [Rhizobium leguminosarum]|uniref:hypothetical protein n=1 Tax=Rhizobium leguminosarum TaxID=384 RepID=UPI001C96862D|nr:hypothetical protein [Rhizobium leguminosarum]MBY5739953.1 hypothetical protein [Rhizobium leguminosarum]